MAIFRGTGSASATTDQTTIDTTTQNVVDAEAAQAAAEAARDAAEVFKDDAEALYGDLDAVNTAKTAAETAASNAATSESNAATSESNAATSATNAEDAYQDTLTAFLGFENNYLGAKASDPTLNNQGEALEVGALYFNTTDDVLRTYDGSEWFTAVASLTDALINSNNLSDLTNVATARTNLGLGTAATTASTDYATAAQGTLADSALQPSDNISELTNDSGYITDYTVTEGDVTAHQAALTITESQISDLQSYLTDYTVTEGDVTAHQAALSITESQISDFGTYEPADADILKADTADTITAPMRGTVTTDNDLSFDMNATNNFKATPSGTGTLTFTNITAGQSGNIYLDNSGGHVISAAASTYISAADLTTISTAGVYWVSYFSDGTNVLCSVTPALTASGA